MRVDDYIRPDFSELDYDEQDNDWHTARAKAEENAIIAWNRRPWEGSYFPEELEDLERKEGIANTTNARNALN